MSAEEQLQTILTVMNNQFFGQRQSGCIVGGRGRLFRLIERGQIRATKPSDSQNGKWMCNASDVLRYALYKKVQ